MFKRFIWPCRPACCIACRTACGFGPRLSGALEGLPIAVVKLDELHEPQDPRHTVIFAQGPAEDRFQRRHECLPALQRQGYAPVGRRRGRVGPSCRVLAVPGLRLIPAGAYPATGAAREPTVRGCWCVAQLLSHTGPLRSPAGCCSCGPSGGHQPEPVQRRAVPPERVWQRVRVSAGMSAGRAAACAESSGRGRLRALPAASKQRP